MISYSSNLATNLLMQQVGIQTIQSILSSSGLKNMAIVRLLEDIRAFEQGIVNTTTAEALLHQLEAIRDASLFTPASSTLMLDMLKAQRFNDGIPAGLPPGTVVAHKTGEITRHHHDAGVVYGPRPFTLVILTRGVAERSTSARLIAEMAGAVYAAIMRDAAAAPHTTPDND
jgi:beta-lactamase class A